MLISLYTTLIVTFFAEICVYGLVARQGDPIVSGFYTIWAISTAGFPIGVIPGSFVGVENSTDPSPSSDNEFAVFKYPEGYVLHLTTGNAATSSGGVVLVNGFPGTYWNIVSLNNGLYAIETTDGSLGWILPHDAPPGTPVALTLPLNPRIPAEYFEFLEVM